MVRFFRIMSYEGAVLNCVNSVMLVGSFRFDRIGSPYPTWVPVFGLRFVPALAGSMVPPLCYLICREMNISVLFSFLAGLIAIFGKQAKYGR